MAEYIERETLAEEIRVALSCAENRRMRSAGLSVDFDKIRNEERMMFLSRVMRAPAADVVKVVHGRWYQNEDTGDRLAACSECNEVYDLADGSLTEFAEFYRFCPACGARMDGGIND